MMNESKPLLANNGTEIDRNGAGAKKEGSTRDSSGIKISGLGLGALAISLVVVGVLIGSSMTSRSASPSNVTSAPPPPPIDDPPSSSTSKTRPFCRIYGEQLKFAGVLQTSIGDPSQQWSHIPCYAQPKRQNTRLWANQDTDSDNAAFADINGYGAPDAVFKIDFGRPAFPYRQPIVGFGAAFTEASSLNYQSLSNVAKERLMELLFGKTGIGYSIGAYCSHDMSCRHNTYCCIIGHTIIVYIRVLFYVSFFLTILLSSPIYFILFYFIYYRKSSTELL